jgi:DNA-binding CsgD family transcriptional regulator
MKTPSRPIRPDDFEVFAQIPGVLGVARDADLRVIWCTASYCRIAGDDKSIEDMIGTTVEDMVPPEAAKDRIKIHREVMESGVVQSHFRLMDDTRVISTVYPLDESAFGHKGVFILVQDASVHSKFLEGYDIPMIASSNLYKLEPLTARELEVLHHVASGLSTRQIADRLHRAEKTVEHHINAIHSKLDTSSRAQLVRWASERGIQSFSEVEWSELVMGVQKLRRGIARV